MARAFASGDEIDIPNSGGVNTTAALAFWFKTTQTGLTALATKNDGLFSSRNGFTVVTNGVANKLGVAMIRAAGEFMWSLNSSATANDGAWHHAAFNFDYTTASNGNQFWMDGTSVGTATSVGSLSTVSTSIRLGDAVDGAWGNFVGDMAEVAVWSRKLLADEVAALAKGFRPTRIAPAALDGYAPMVRELIDPTYGALTPVSGTTASGHPRIIG